MRCQDTETSLTAAQSLAAGSGLKAMVPVGRPFLDYVLTALADAEFRHACLVIGPEHQVVREYYTSKVRPQRIQVAFAVQSEPIGTANALLAAEEFADSDEVLVINSDNYYPHEALCMVQELGQPGTVLFDAESLVRASNIPRERIRAFAYCTVDRHGFLADIIEKPESAEEEPMKLVSMNCWRFGSEIFEFCRQVPLSTRGEYELTSAVKLALETGTRFKAATCRAGVLDLSQRSDIAEVAARLHDVEVRL